MGKPVFAPKLPTTKPLVIIAKQLVRNGVHVLQVVQISTYATKHTEHHLNEVRRRHPSLLDKPGQVVEVAKVVALELKLRAVLLAECFHDVLNVGEGVLEDEIACHL